MARLGKYLSLCLVGILAVSSLSLVKPVIASNDWIWEDLIIPNPTITWENPERNIEYNASMPLEFNITYPRPEKFVNSDMYFLHVVEYSIDGTNTTSIKGKYYHDNIWSSGQLELDISRMSNGLHNITVTAYFTVLFANIGSPTDNPYTFPQKSFQINNQITNQPISSPTVPEFPFLLVIPLLLSLLVVALIVRKNQLSNKVFNMR